MQTAAALPVFLLVLPSGAMADIVDRRRWFIGTQLWLTATAGLFALAAVTGALSASLILLLVFVNGVGMALRWPVYSALMPELVCRDELPQALALHAVAVNVSRIVGPVLAGALLAWSSEGTAVFVVGTALALLSALLVWRWRYVPQPRTLPSEPLPRAMRVGWQFVAQSPPMRVTLARIFLLFLQVSSLLALLPLLAKGLGDGDESTYTLLFSSMGVGAIAMALTLPRLRQRLGTQTLVNGGTLLLAACIAGIALAQAPWMAVAAMVLAGAA